MIIIKLSILYFIQIRHTDHFPSTGTRLVQIMIRGPHLLHQFDVAVSRLLAKVQPVNKIGIGAYCYVKSLWVQSIDFNATCRLQHLTYMSLYGISLKFDLYGTYRKMYTVFIGLANGG